MKIVILTGAGISAESGLGTFRDVGGLWSQYDLKDVATPQGFARDPDLVHRFYNARRANCIAARPNAAHEALARLQHFAQGDAVIVTQNIDDLHERAGARVIHMHGEVMRALCAACGLFVAIGTSGAVYPAAGFVAEARAAGARTLELNLEPSDVAGLFVEIRQGPATRLVPRWVDEVLERM